MTLCIGVAKVKKEEFNSVISYGLADEELRDFAEIMDTEYIHIGKETDLHQFRKELTWNDLVWKLKK